MSYTLRFSEQAKKDIKAHKKVGSQSVVSKIKKLTKDIALHPFSGIDKPEPLKHSLSVLWSRRINREHRLVCEVDNVVVIFTQLKNIIASEQLRLIAELDEKYKSIEIGT